MRRPRWVAVPPPSPPATPKPIRRIFTPAVPDGLPPPAPPDIPLLCHTHLEGVALELDLVRLGVVLLLGKVLLDLAQVEKLAGELGPLLLAQEGLLEVGELGLVPQPHGVHEFSRVALVLAHLPVPVHVELLVLEHVRLLDAQPLGQLPRPHRLLSPVLLVHLRHAAGAGGGPLSSTHEERREQRSRQENRRVAAAGCLSPPPEDCRATGGFPHL